MTTFHAWAAHNTGGPLQPFDYDPGPLDAEDVEITVEHCGICHSDLALIDSEWGPTNYPIVPGHEVVGRVTAVGPQVKGLQLGQRVGVGWHTRSCMHCRPCIGGEQHLCATRQPTIVGRHGGFADKLRSHWAWAVPIPDALDPASVGPLMCGGITVFSPLLIHEVTPLQRIGVVGIGGLGHLAVKFARAWGCEVTAFTSSAAKRDEALALGAHRTVSSIDKADMKRVAGSIDFLIVTVGATLDWDALMGTLAPKGRLHLVGVVTDGLKVRTGSLMNWQRSISSSPTGSPGSIARMLDFAARHQITAQVERFPMARVNDAIDHLRSGKARYRVVLDA
jgi:alcohol/geraniol dehydrogenase (NADP+)